MFISIEKACELTGRSKNALYRLMNQGRINYVNCTKGKRYVEVAELRRVYGQLNGTITEPDPRAQNFAPSELNDEVFTMLNLMRAELEVLNDKIDRQSEMIEKLQSGGVVMRESNTTEPEAPVNAIITAADSPEKDPEWPPYITCYADLEKRDEIKAKYAFMAKYGK